jgi:hypothetical protein
MVVSRPVLAATLPNSYYRPLYELMEEDPRPGFEELARTENYRLWSGSLARPDGIARLLVLVVVNLVSAPVFELRRFVRIENRAEYFL